MIGMPRRRISREEALLAIKSDDQAVPVRYFLQCLEDSHPGGTIELRVPPFGVAQIVEGLEHRRGTPPNVVEIAPELFIKLCLGEASFDDHQNTKALTLSGTRAVEVSKLFPLGSDLY